MRRIAFILLLIFACDRKGEFVRIDFKLDSSGGVPVYVSSITVSVRWDGVSESITAIVPVETLEAKISVPAGEKREFTAFASVDDGTPVLFGKTIQDVLPDLSNDVNIYMGLIELNGFIHDPLGDSGYCDINGVLVKRVDDVMRMNIWLSPKTPPGEGIFFYIFLDLDQNQSTFMRNFPTGEIGPDAGVIIYAGEYAGGYVFNEWDKDIGMPSLYYFSHFPAYITGNKISIDVPVLAFGKEDGFMDFTVTGESEKIGRLDSTGVGRMREGSPEPANPFLTYSKGIISLIAGSTLGDGGPAINAPLAEYVNEMTVSGNEIIINGAMEEKGFLRKIDLSTGKIYNLAGIITDNPQDFIEAEFPIQVTIPITRGIALDGGDIIFSDPYECTIKRLSLSTETLTTVAGVPGQCEYNGDGPASSVPLNSPSELFVLNGEIYFSDTGNNLVRKVTSDGNVQTIAGYHPSSCDSIYEATYVGPATEACLSSPSGISPDGLGGFYIADTGNYIVRDVDYTGTITTVAGNGNYGQPITGHIPLYSPFHGPEDVFLWSGFLFILDNGHLFYYDYDGYLSDITTPTISAIFPSDYLYFSSDEGFLYSIEDIYNPTPIKLAGPSFPYSLHGGDGEDALYSSLEDPVGLDVYNGDVYFLERNVSSLYKISSSTRKLERIAGNGISKICSPRVPISSAPDTPVFSFPKDIAIGSDGKIYVADGDCTVKVVDFSKNEIRIFAGNCECGLPLDGANATSSPLGELFYIETGSDGSVYLSMMEIEYLYSIILSIDPKGIIHRIGGNPDGITFSDYTAPTPATNVNFGFISFMSIDKELPYLYIVSDGGALWRINLTNNVAELLTSEGEQGIKGALQIPSLSCAIPFENDFFIGCTYDGRIMGFNRYTGFRIAGYKPGFKGMGKTALDSLIYEPIDIDLDGGEIYILLGNPYGIGGRILKISPLQ